jgi:predicted transcriptional regulator
MRTFGELEERIMTVVWDRNTPVTVRVIVNDLAATRPAAYSTVITVVERLRAKGWLSRERDGRSYQYHATRSRHEYVADLMGAVLEESSDRSAALLSFAGQLDPNDAVSLRRALQSLDDSPPR